MKQRCLNRNHPHYKDYGGRGIQVCERWIDSFENFLEDMGEHPDGTTLDRVDNNGHYYKENCQWTTSDRQRRNTRRIILVTINNKTQCLKDWCNLLSLKYSTILARINKLNWTTEEALGLKARQKYLRKS